MDARPDGEAAPPGGGTKVVRASEREVVVTRVFDAPVRIVFAAWTTPELFMRWWAPKSLGVPLRSCRMDVRTGGTYRLEFGHDGANAWAFHGRYIEVLPNARLVWTNEEGADGAVSTVTFEDDSGKTLLTYRELYPSRAALDEGLAGIEAAPEQFAQLDDLLAALASEP